MKITSQPSSLAQALQIVSRAISSRSTLPILNNVLLETTAEGLALTSTNLELGVRKVVPAEVEEEGSTTAPARLLADFVSTLPPEPLEMSLDTQTMTMGMRCGRFDTHLKCIEAEEFPPTPSPDGGDRFVIPVEELLSAIEQTQIAASTDEARPILTGELLQVEGSTVTLVATDGHRLAERKLAGGTEGLDLRLIVPVKALSELPRAFRNDGGDVEITVSAARNQIFFRSGTSEINSRLIDGNYPNYPQVIPKKSSTVIRLPTADLTQTVRSVALFAKDAANVIRFRVGSDTLVLSATTNEVGDSKAELPAEVEGSEVQIAFNARYVLDALSTLGGETVEIHFDGPLSPGVFRWPGVDGYLSLVMPVRVAM
ncbi:MAG TPA: DNA polymerase III subunit beta [Candidatus Dormibacteraeota bacterium]|nr:DNA polymerase III subunit beta [Candidatus Dormibacteraeota bacterium]